eukprot:GFUD01096091.1.p1 GENE.GFUD01096091.1~~GFUD01096091.1.p1  ORF type:complete len:106 (-),score=1.96 GFUD01096091.1:61-378(-)
MFTLFRANSLFSKGFDLFTHLLLCIQGIAYSSDNFSLFSKKRKSHLVPKTVNTLQMNKAQRTYSFKSRISNKNYWALPGQSCISQPGQPPHYPTLAAGIPHTFLS